jgi:hypothetical protein
VRKQQLQYFVLADLLQNVRTGFHLPFSNVLHWNENLLNCITADVLRKQIQNCITADVLRKQIQNCLMKGVLFLYFCTFKVHDFRYNVHGATGYLMPVTKYHFVNSETLKFRFVTATEKRHLAGHPTAEKLFFAPKQETGCLLRRTCPTEILKYPFQTYLKSCLKFKPTKCTNCNYFILFYFICPPTCFGELRFSRRNTSIVLCKLLRCAIHATLKIFL